MTILAIDPGPIQSAYVLFGEHGILNYGKIDNHDLRSNMKFVEFDTYDRVVIEMIASYGMAVGKEVFETCVWIGRFIEASLHTYISPDLIYRKDIKMHICGQTKAKDANIRQALIDRFGAPGTKKKPGHTFGISGDMWAALAVAVTYWDTQIVGK